MKFFNRHSYVSFPPSFNVIKRNQGHNGLLPSTILSIFIYVINLIFGFSFHEIKNHYNTKNNKKNYEKCDCERAKKW